MRSEEDDPTLKRGRKKKAARGPYKKKINATVEKGKNNKQNKETDNEIYGAGA